jgi:hypothetical protein
MRLADVDERAAVGVQHDEDLLGLPDPQLTGGLAGVGLRGRAHLVDDLEVRGSEMSTTMIPAPLTLSSLPSVRLPT